MPEISFGIVGLFGRKDRNVLRKDRNVAFIALLRILRDFFTVFILSFYHSSRQKIFSHLKNFNSFRDVAQLSSFPMKELLTKRLRGYIIENHPDLWINLMEERRQNEYLNQAINDVDALLDRLIAENHPPYIIGEVCMEQLTRPLRPSRYNYVKAIAEDKYPRQVEALYRSGILVTELANIVAVCLPIFEVLNFSELTEDDDYLREAIATAMKGYFKTV